MIFPGQYRWEILLLAKQSAPKLQAKKGNPQNDFLMVVMPNNIACGYNMAAILQIIGWQRHAALVYCVLLWKWTFMLWSTDNCQTRYLLTSIMWPYHRFKFTAHQGHMFFFLSWPLTKCWFSIGSQAHVRWTCWKQGRIVWKPGLKVNWITTFSSLQIFFAALVLCIWWLLNLKIEGQKIYR